jgi:hypothetical protein
MPIQVDGTFLRAPCPVGSCPACEPNSGSVLPSLSSKATRVEGADIVMQSSGPPDSCPETHESVEKSGGRKRKAVELEFASSGSDAFLKLTSSETSLSRRVSTVAECWRLLLSQVAHQPL